MRASTDFFVVGMTGIGTALFLTQLLVISRQIVAADHHIQSELAAEKTAVPVSWMHPLARLVLRETFWNGQCCPPPVLPPGPPFVQPALPPLAHFVAGVRPEYPRRALDHNVDGYVDFVFTVTPSGSPLNPKISAEVPERYGFAAAAKAVFAKWRFRPEPSDRTVRYRMSFVHPNDQGYLP